MNIPSITAIVGVAFLAYICHSLWLMLTLFTTLRCTGNPCYTSFLDNKPHMQLALFVSSNRNPIASEVTKVFSERNFDYHRPFQRDLEIDVPLKVRRNGTFHMQVVLALDGASEPALEWKTLRREGPTIIQSMRLTEYMIPRVAAFNLLGEKQEVPVPPMSTTKTTSKTKTTRVNSVTSQPVTHLMSQVHVVLLTDQISLSHQDVPPEMASLIHVNRHQQILPILKTDFFHMRLKDLVQVTKNTTEFTVQFNFKPIGIGKLRLMLMIEHAMKMIHSMGFSQKDIDEVKSVFSDINVYVLCGTVLIASVHILFDFLSFKNDVSFWRKKRSYAGLSTRTTLWRAFSQMVIFLSLLDENTTMLVLVPAGLAVFIELWKCKKILKLKIGLRGIKVGRQREAATVSLNQTNGHSHGHGKDAMATVAESERKTEEFDKQGMKYLSYVLYPLCVAGAVYSLLYQPHRSWYSWTLNSLVNGVYAFGFLFMLPQLFVNYKLKSVAALPWRSFMYKAFNTFIDDVFAFIITMPTAHRVACLRDDVVFIIYLYQRWLYPVDKSRVDTSLAIEEHEHVETARDCDDTHKHESDGEKKKVK